jgi:hypothetical protein
MHPVEKKSQRLTIYTCILAAIVAVLAFIANKSYLLIVIVHVIFWYDNRKKIPKAETITAIFLITSCILTFTIEFYIITPIFEDYYNAILKLLLSFSITMLIFIVPYYFIYRHFMDVLGMAVVEKKNYFAFKRHPNLLCTSHLVRTGMKKELGFRDVYCRIDKSCMNKKNVIYAKHLAGLIGKKEKSRGFQGTYYVTLWDNKRKTIKNGDYDIIEIHKSNEIKDYDAVISKVTSFFYNELNRYKPINQITIRIFDNVTISESTKRLIEKHYQRIEYVTV